MGSHFFFGQGNLSTESTWAYPIKNNSLLVIFSSGNIGSGPFFSLNALYAYKTREHLVRYQGTLFSSIIVIIIIITIIIFSFVTSEGNRFV